MAANSAERVVRQSDYGDLRRTAEILRRSVEELKKDGVPSCPFKDFSLMFADPFVRSRSMQVKVQTWDVADPRCHHSSAPVKSIVRPAARR